MNYTRNPTEAAKITSHAGRFETLNDSIGIQKRIKTDHKYLVFSLLTNYKNRRFRLTTPNIHSGKATKMDEHSKRS